jgi:hypothetical protein
MLSVFESWFESYFNRITNHSWFSKYTEFPFTRILCNWFIYSKNGSGWNSMLWFQFPINIYDFALVKPYYECLVIMYLLIVVYCTCLYVYLHLVTNLVFNLLRTTLYYKIILVICVYCSSPQFWFVWQGDWWGRCGRVSRSILECCALFVSLTIAKYYSISIGSLGRKTIYCLLVCCCVKGQELVVCRSLWALCDDVHVWLCAGSDILPSEGISSHQHVESTVSSNDPEIRT